MAKINLVLGTINTFPSGLEADRIEDIYQGYVVPVLKSLYNRRKLNLTFYFSGTMLEWLEANHSEYISAFSEMLQQRRVELLGGGFYDPIFPVIPRLDRLGQFEHLTNKVRQTFNKKPRGAWISNFFWEADMASILNTSGFEYTFLDDSLFTRAGMEAKDLYYPAITEDQGKTLVVFPVSGQSRRMFWKSSPEALIDFILSQANEAGDRVISLMYDCSMYSQDLASDTELRLTWLNRFFDLLEASQDRKEIETVVPSKLLRRGMYMTRAYFEAPTLEEVHAAAVGQSLVPGAYSEPQVLLPGVNRLGYFAQKNVRHSLARYPEVNLLYAKMQYIHTLVSQLKGDKYRKQASRECLWQAQNHAPYWHGPDGGLYRNSYRKTAYTNLIEAEKQAREKGVFAPGIINHDFDFDGVNELLYQGNDLNCYIHCRGGIVFELDYLPGSWNYADTCSRHPEMYHLAAQESEGYDSYPRRLFIDHFLPKDIDIASFMRGDFEEQGSFVNDLYQLIGAKRESMDLHLQRQGFVQSKGRQLPLLLEKTYQFNKFGLQLTWNLSNQTDEDMSLCFSPELNLGFASEDVRDLRVFCKEARGKNLEISPDQQELESVTELVFHDLGRKLALTLSFSDSIPVWLFPLYTSIKTSEGFVQDYQASTVLPFWKIDLAPRSVQTLSLGLNFTKLTSKTNL